GDARDGTRPRRGAVGLHGIQAADALPAAMESRGALCGQPESIIVIRRMAALSRHGIGRAEPRQRGAMQQMMVQGKGQRSRLTVAAGVNVKLTIQWLKPAKWWKCRVAGHSEWTTRC